MVKKYFHIILTLVLFTISQQSFGKYIAEPDTLECFIQNKSMGLRNRFSKSLVVPCKYECITGFSQFGMSPAKRNGKWGYITRNGIEKISPKYEEAKGFSSDLGAVKLNNKWGFINKIGRIIIPLKYDEVESFSRGYSIVKINNKYGVINPKGVMVVPCKYSKIKRFIGEDKYNICLNDKWGVCDANGKIIIECLYDKDLYFQNGFSAAKKDGKWGMINLQNDIIVPFSYDDVFPIISEGLMRVEKNDKIGFVDCSGKQIIPCKYNDSSFSFENGVASLEDDNGTYIVGKDSRILASFPNSFDINIVDYCDTPLFVVWKNDDACKCGLYDKTGKEILPIDYARIHAFYGDGLIGLKKGNLWGFVSIDGKLKIPFKYEDISRNFIEGIAAAKLDGKWGLIRPDGEIAIDFKYDLIDPNFTFIRTKMNGKWGALSLSAQSLIGNKYDDISYPNTRLGYFPVKIGEKDGFADYYGNDTF